MQLLLTLNNSQVCVTEMNSNFYQLICSRHHLLSHEHLIVAVVDYGSMLFQLSRLFWTSKLKVFDCKECTLEKNCFIKEK